MTDININVDLGVDQALLDKLKKQRAESRQQERPFVPKTIADSSVLPNQETRAGSTDFSTNIYTSNESLSRNRDTTDIVPVATSSFSRQTFTQAYNQAQVRTVDAQGRKRYYDPDQRIWVDEPNRLLYSRRQSVIVCFCVIDENSSQIEIDTPTTFRNAISAVLPDAEVYHVVINFLADDASPLTLLEEPDGVSSFIFQQPRVDGYDWISRLQDIIGISFNPAQTLIFYCIDESGSMTKEDVSESLQIFARETSEYSFPPLDITMSPFENMYLPFTREDVLTAMTEAYDSY